MDHIGNKEDNPIANINNSTTPVKHHTKGVIINRAIDFNNDAFANSICNCSALSSCISTIKIPVVEPEKNIASPINSPPKSNI